MASRPSPYSAWLKPAALYGALFLALAVFAELAEDVYRREGFPWDRALLAGFHALRSPFLDGLARLLTLSASLPAMALATGGVLLWAFRRGLSWPRFLLVLGGSEALNLLGKHLLARPRPHLFPQLTPEHDFSFPSGHAMASLALVLGLSWLLQENPKASRLVLLLGLPWAFGVALSRLYLQVHYPSDVLAGWALTLAWFLGLRLILGKDAASPGGG
ncbi:phosphatase PAP2 family protein [Thermus sp.]|jgi:undecaprenyl-diphosphatase|uniref:phosphatase PAP2 family protein n=1 Tax=Thermus sp. TaxID=275 RepID=UPI00321FBC48